MPSQQATHTPAVIASGVQEVLEEEGAVELARAVLASGSVLLYEGGGLFGPLQLQHQIKLDVDPRRDDNAFPM